MIKYQRIVLSTGATVGEPADLPAELRGLSVDALADLSNVLDPTACAELGYVDTAFTQVEVEDPPVSRRWVHRAIFKRRFTSAERIAIRLAESDDAVPLQVRLALTDFREVLDATTEVYLDDVDLIAGLDLLVTLGLLASGRPAQIRE